MISIFQHEAGACPSIAKLIAALYGVIRSRTCLLWLNGPNKYSRGAACTPHPLKAPSLSLQTLQPALVRSTILYLQLRLAFTFSHATYTYAPFNDALTLIVREWRDAVARPRQQSNLRWISSLQTQSQRGFRNRACF